MKRAIAVTVVFVIGWNVGHNSQSITPLFIYILGVWGFELAWYLLKTVATGMSFPGPNS